MVPPGKANNLTFVFFFVFSKTDSFRPSRQEDEIKCSYDPQRPVGNGSLTEVGPEVSRIFEIPNPIYSDPEIQNSDKLLFSRSK